MQLGKRVGSATKLTIGKSHRSETLLWKKMKLDQIATEGAIYTTARPQPTMVFFTTYPHPFSISTHMDFQTCFLHSRMRGCKAIRKGDLLSLSSSIRRITRNGPCGSWTKSPTIYGSFLFCMIEVMRESCYSETLKSNTQDRGRETLEKEGKHERKP